MTKRTGWKKRLASALLALGMGLSLVACGNSQSQQEPAPAQSTPQTASAPQEETPGFDFSTAAFLTGEEKTADYPEGQRMVAVMVNNIRGSRPTSGLSAADVLYEIKVEGGITRFMALFADYNTMPEVGGVRSARDQFLQMVIPFQPFYVHEGPGSRTVPVSQMMTDYDMWEFDIQPTGNGSTFYRRNRPGMSSEYTQFTTEGGVAKAIENNNLNWNRQYNSPMFNFVPYTDPYVVPDEGSSNEIAIVHSDSYRTFFEYAGGSYLMSQRDSSGVTATLDENNGQQLAFQNVLVIFAGMSQYSGSELVKVDYASGGAGYLFTQGGWETVYWMKPAPYKALELYSLRDMETPIQLNPGRTYVAVVDDKQLESFDGVLRAGTASEVAGGGADGNDDVDTVD